MFVCLYVSTLSMFVCLYVSKLSMFVCIHIIYVYMFVCICIYIIYVYVSTLSMCTYLHYVHVYVQFPLLYDHNKLVCVLIFLFPFFGMGRGKYVRIYVRTFVCWEF